MKDFIGVPLNIGDRVAFATSISEYVEAKIVGYTPKKVKLQSERTTWNRHTKTREPVIRNYLKFPKQLISLEGTYELHPEILL